MYTLMVVSGEHRHEAPELAFDHSFMERSQWNAVPSHFQPPGVVGVTTQDPHPELAYADRQYFPVDEVRKSGGELSQGNGGQSRVERAIRQRTSNPPSKDAPPARIEYPYETGSGFPGQLSSVSECALSINRASYNIHWLAPVPISGCGSECDKDLDISA